MAKTRKQTYTMAMYLDKVRDMDIRNDSDVQRRFVWNKEQINELIVTILTEDYIPPIILGEEDSSQLWIVDGGQRTAALASFRHGNYKITPTIGNSVIQYKAKVKDKKGNIVWKDTAFDVRNKSYDKLPDELKKKFNEYQIETVIHEHCDNHRISQLIKRYNNHTSMNTNQKAFTYIDNFARDIRRILNCQFFLNCSAYTEAEKNKGVVERVIVETVMCSNHLEQWKKQTKSICIYLNRNADKEEFQRLEDNLHRLENIVTDDIKDIFNSKDSFIFLTLFDKFTKLGMRDIEFARFLKEFKDNLRYTEINGILYDDIDKDKGTKDKAVIIAKLSTLKTLMTRFLNIDNVTNEEDEEAFIVENVGVDADELHEDMGFYKDTLEDLKNRTIRAGSLLLSRENQLSLLAMVVYSYKEDMDLDVWLADYAKRNDTYIPDQRKNFINMKNDFEKFKKVPIF